MCVSPPETMPRDIITLLRPRSLLSSAFLLAVIGLLVFIVFLFLINWVSSLSMSSLALPL